MARHERDILERAVQAVADQAKKARAIVDEAHNANLDGSHPVTLQAKMLRLEILNVKADLERELGRRSQGTRHEATIGLHRPRARRNVSSCVPA